MVVRKLSGADLAQYDTEREDVGGKIELVSEQDFGGHVRVGTAEREALRFLFVAGGDACKTKVGYFEAAVGGHKEILALEVAVDAFTSMEICKGACDVRGKGKAELPGKWPGLVVYVYAHISIFDEFGNDEDAVVGGWGAAEADEETDVWMTAFFHQPPLPFKVLGYVILRRRQNLFNRYIDPQVAAYRNFK